LPAAAGATAPAEAPQWRQKRAPTGNGWRQEAQAAAPVRLLPHALQKRPVALAPHAGHREGEAVTVVAGKSELVRNPNGMFGGLIGKGE
jgi:hypothetical protein